MSNALMKLTAILVFAVVAGRCIAAPPPCKALADKASPNANCVDTPRSNAAGKSADGSGNTKDQAKPRGASGGSAGGPNPGAAPAK